MAKEALHRLQVDLKVSNVLRAAKDSFHLLQAVKDSFHLLQAVKDSCHFLQALKDSFHLLQVPETGLEQSQVVVYQLRELRTDSEHPGGDLCQPQGPKTGSEHPQMARAQTPRMIVVKPIQKARVKSLMIQLLQGVK
tara:strand:- start:163 stop:573 length:411 start_codon:yes stop_codon:yes gene_type:complete